MVKAMGQWKCMAALVLLLAVSPSAFGQDLEVSPKASAGPVLVAAGTDETIYYALDAGQSLEYNTVGPTELLVQARIRLPKGTAPDASTSGVVEALGDGVFRIPDIAVKQSAVAGGVIYDTRGGVPSGAGASTVTVPQGGKFLTLKAPAGGPSYLVRVTKKSTDGAVATVPVVTPVPGTSAAAPTVATTEPATVPTMPVEPPTPEAMPTPEGESTGSTDFVDWLLDHDAMAGPELGLGLPARGTAAIFYWGVEGRLSPIEDMLDVALAIGSYRVGVEETYNLTDPFAGPLSIEADYHTSVVPITVEGLYRIPVTLADLIRPYAGAGAGLYITRRADGAERTSGVSLGTELLGGIDIDAGPGAVSVSASWNGVRHDYGNLNDDGEEVKETLATVRVNTAYLYRF